MIRMQRAKWRMSQSQLADQMRGRGINWTQASVSRAERDASHLRLEELVALAAVFGLSVGEFVTSPK